MKSVSTLLLLFSGLAATAQISIDTSTLHYVQNFDGLDSIGTGLSSMPQGWSFFEWGGSSANATYRAGTGSTIAGDTYSYGLSGSSDRALGSLCSAGMPDVCYGVRFVNRTGSYLNAVDITLKAEQWRRNGSGKPDSMLFYYSTAPNARVNDSSFSKWIQVPELLITSVTTALPAAAINGNDSCRRISFSLPLSLADGDSICFRWYDFNAAASDDGLAIDSLDMLFRQGIPADVFRPRVVSLFPAPGAQLVPLTTVPIIEFNRGISKGSTGAVYIKDRSTQQVQVLTIGNSKLKVNDRVASLTFLNLLPGRTYQITYDSATFDTAGYRCMGLYDTTAWTFTTESPNAIGQVFEREFVDVCNPVHDGMLKIEFNSSAAVFLMMNVADLQGKVVFNRKLELNTGKQISIHQLRVPPGLYVLNIQSENGCFRQKILFE